MADFHAFSPDVNTIEQEAMEVLVHEGREGQEEESEQGNLEMSPTTCFRDMRIFLKQLHLLNCHRVLGGDQQPSGGAEEINHPQRGTAGVQGHLQRYVRRLGPAGFPRVRDWWRRGLHPLPC